jgi:hypothetical protein
MSTAAGGLDALAKLVMVVAAVGDPRAVGGETGEHLGHGAHVGGLAGGECEAHRQSMRADAGVDPGGQSATRTTDGVIGAPFLPPAACRCARRT